MRSWLSLGGLGVRIVESRAKSESGEKSKEEEREREWAEMRELALTPYPIPRCLFSAHISLRRPHLEQERLSQFQSAQTTSPRHPQGKQSKNNPCCT